MPTSPRRFVEQVRGILSERRNLSRIPCDIVMLDGGGCAHRIENIGLSGIRYAAPVLPPEGAQRFTLRLPNLDSSLPLEIRPVWVKQREGFGWDVGASVSCDGEDRRRWQYIVNSLKENREFNDLRWVPFAILDAPLTPPDLLDQIGRRELKGAAGRAARGCGTLFKRPYYYWQWADEVIRRFTLSSVHPAWFEAAVSIKLISSVFFTAVDDIADDLQDKRFYRQLIARVQQHRMPPGDEVRDPQRARQLRMLTALWRYLVHAARGLPRYREVVDCLRFDAATILHSMSHSLVVNHSPSAICEAEQQLWNVGAAYLLLFTDIDLMCSPDLELDEFGSIRQITLEAQQMCAVANWIGTWEREVRSGDYSSAVIGQAIQRNIVTPEALDAGPDEDTLVASIRDTDIETALMARWEKHWFAIDRQRHTMKSIDVSSYLHGLEDFFKLHIAARERLEEAPQRGPASGAMPGAG